MESCIINRGRGPEIQGTRITVYDIMDYRGMQWSNERIAEWLRLTIPQVECAQQYIDQHLNEVEMNYRKILERNARGNPPEIQAKLDAIHEKYKVLWKDRFVKTFGADYD